MPTSLKDILSSGAQGVGISAFLLMTTSILIENDIPNYITQLLILASVLFCFVSMIYMLHMAQHVQPRTKFIGFLISLIEIASACVIVAGLFLFDYYY